jgi:predicted small lipoprotein YifL
MSTPSKIAVVASPVAVLVLALALAGCGAGGTAEPPTTSPTGDVSSSVSTVSGTAVDSSTRQPLTGVDIAFYKLPEADGTPYVHTTTDALGRYSVDLDTGDWRAFATVFGHPQVNFDIVPSGGTNKIITVPGAASVDFLLWSYE